LPFALTGYTFAQRWRRKVISEYPFYRTLLIVWFSSATVFFTVLFFVSAPYGRYSRPGWGPTTQSRFGWLIMESASPIIFSFFLLAGNNYLNLAIVLFMCMWHIHYLQRAFLYPFRMRNGKKPMPLSVVVMALFFNAVNGYLNGRYLNLSSTLYSAEWLKDPRFIIGSIIFFTGYLINLQSDSILRKIRSPGEMSYKIPEGGVFNYVSCANYFGEIFEWFGWACLTWSLPGLAFAIWTASNLMPRAKAHHNWYQENFPDYPKNRKAIIPFLF
jgi:hypothetical protein